MTKIEIEMLEDVPDVCRAGYPVPARQGARRRAAKKQQIALSSGLMGIVTMCRCAIEGPNVGGGAWRVLSERGFAKRNAWFESVTG